MNYSDVFKAELRDKSIEQVRKDVLKFLDEQEKALEQESAIADFRDALVTAALEYLVALGLLPDYSMREVESVTKVFKDWEAETKSLREVAKKLKVKSTKTDDDDAISSFLRSIR